MTAPDPDTVPLVAGGQGRTLAEIEGAAAVAALCVAPLVLLALLPLLLVALVVASPVLLWRAYAKLRREARRSPKSSEETVAPSPAGAPASDCRSCAALLARAEHAEAEAAHFRALLTAWLDKRNRMNLPPRGFARAVREALGREEPR
jgi:Flp pilus assembly protein TadB